MLLLHTHTCTPSATETSTNLFTTLFALQAGQLAAAEGVLGDMAAAGVKPTTISFTTLIDGHVRAGDMAAARRVLQAMRAAGETPNVVTYNSLLRGYFSAANGNKGGVGSSSGGGGGSGMAALVVAGEAPSLETDAAGDEADGRVAATGPLAAAQQLLQEMQAEGVSPTTDTVSGCMGWKECGRYWPVRRTVVS